MKKIGFLILAVFVALLGFLFFKPDKEDLTEMPQEEEVSISEKESEKEFEDIHIEEPDNIVEEEEVLSDGLLSLKLVGNHTTPGQAEFVFVDNDKAFVADGCAGVTIFDVSDPEDASYISGYDTPGYSEGLFVLDDLVFVADKDGGFVIIDISDIEEPKLLSRVNTISVEGVSAKDNYVYAGYAWWGLKVYDISDLASPLLVWEKDLPDEVEAVFILNDYVFLAKGEGGGLQIFDISYIMTRGGPANSTLFYVYHLFNNAFRYLNMGYASAMAWFLFVVILILTIIQLKVAKYWVHYEGD